MTRLGWAVGSRVPSAVPGSRPLLYNEKTFLARRLEHTDLRGAHTESMAPSKGVMSCTRSRLTLLLLLAQPSHAVAFPSFFQKPPSTTSSSTYLDGLNPLWLDLVLPVRKLTTVLLVGDFPASGACGHASLQRWLGHFRKAVHVGDAELATFAPLAGAYDLVIDVGAHPLSALEHAWAWVRPGGHYIVASARASAPAPLHGGPCAAPRLHWHPLLNASTISHGAKLILDTHIWSWLADGIEADGALVASLVVRRRELSPHRGEVHATLQVKLDDGRVGVRLVDDGRIGGPPRGSTELASYFIKHGTDKFQHRYDHAYSLLFEPRYVLSTRRMLEVGIGTGHCNAHGSTTSPPPSSMAMTSVRTSSTRICSPTRGWSSRRTWWWHSARRACRRLSTAGGSHATYPPAT